MLTYCEALEQPHYGAQYPRPWLFLAGGITGCEDWQARIVKLLDTVGWGGTILNPRRFNFPMGDPTAADAQIAWEHMMLRAADEIVFWFCSETVQPIVLYELGAWSMTTKRIFVGVNEFYERRQDVMLQTQLARPHVPIVESLEALVAMIRG